MGCPFSSLVGRRRNAARVVSRDTSRGENPRLLSATRSLKHAGWEPEHNTGLSADEEQQLLENGRLHHVESYVRSHRHYTSISREAKDGNMVPFVQAEASEVDEIIDDVRIKLPVKLEVDEDAIQYGWEDSLSFFTLIRRCRIVVISQAMAGMFFRALDSGTDIVTTVRLLAHDQVEFATLSLTFVFVCPIVQSIFVYHKRRRWDLALPFLVPGSIQHLRREWRQVRLVHALPQFDLYQNIHVMAGASYFNEALSGFESCFECFPQTLIQWRAFNIDGDADFFSYMSLALSLGGAVAGAIFGLMALHQKSVGRKTFWSNGISVERVWATPSSAGDTVSLYRLDLNNDTCHALSDFIIEDDFITRLDLSETSCDDASIAILVARAHRLASVNLCGCSLVTNAGLEELAENCNGLSKVELRGCILITDEGLTKLAAKCKGLTDVNLSGCRITDEGLDKLSESCEGLTRVVLSFCSFITDKGSNKVAEKCKCLREVYLNRCELITNKVLDKLVENCKGLAVVALSGCNRITDTDLEKLGANCKRLTEVGLSDCNLITDKGLIKLAESCNNLANLFLRGCKQITNESLTKLAENCKGLSLVHLADCNRISDEGLKKLAENCKGLTVVDLSGCDLITDDSLEKLAEMCKGLTKVSLNRCSRVTDKGLKKLPGVAKLCSK